jgi:hypothetical protein
VNSSAPREQTAVKVPTIGLNGQSAIPVNLALPDSPRHNLSADVLETGSFGDGSKLTDVAICYDCAGDAETGRQAPILLDEAGPLIGLTSAHLGNLAESHFYEMVGLSGLDADLLTKQDFGNWLQSCILQGFQPTCKIRVGQRFTVLIDY